MTDSVAVASSSSSSKLMQITDALLKPLHPIHFVLTMGTGISSIIWYNFPVASIRHGSKYVGIIYFFINLVAFICLSLMFIAKYFILYRRYDNFHFVDLIKNGSMSVFLGAIPMGFATLINMIYFMEPSWYIFTYVLWWIDVALTLFCAWFIVFMMLSVSDFKIEDLNATIFLPLVPLTVASSSGSIIGATLIDYPSWGLSQIIITFMLWGNGVVCALFLFAIYFNKLFVSDFPKYPGTFSAFVPIGILGQAAFGILLNLNNMANLITKHEGLGLLGLGGVFDASTLASIAAVIRICALYISWLLTATGLCITCHAFFALFYRGAPGIWLRTMWAMTFPLGTMAVAFNQMYKMTHVLGFKIMGTIYSWGCVLVTSYCLINTFFFEIPWKVLYNIIIAESNENRHEQIESDASQSHVKQFIKSGNNTTDDEQNINSTSSNNDENNAKVFDDQV